MIEVTKATLLGVYSSSSNFLVQGQERFSFECLCFFLHFLLNVSVDAFLNIFLELVHVLVVLKKNREILKLKAEHYGKGFEEKEGLLMSFLKE